MRGDREPDRTGATVAVVRDTRVPDRREPDAGETGAAGAWRTSLGCAVRVVLAVRLGLFLVGLL